MLFLLNQNKQEIKQLAKDAKFAIGNQMIKVDEFPKESDLKEPIKYQKLATNLYPGDSINSNYCCDNSCNWKCSGSYNYCYNWCNVDLCPGKAWCDPLPEECEPGYISVAPGLCCPESSPIYTPPDRCCPTDFPLYCNVDNGCYAAHWSCTEWGPPCQGASQQTRICTPTSPCASDINMPPESRTCDCAENWDCSGWSGCVGGTQIRSCSDLNACGTSASKPSTSQACNCVEDWTCTPWGGCSAGTQTRICTDSSQCGTSASKPSTSQSCICTNHGSFSCFDGDEYWYNSCGVREEKKKGCGSFACSGGVCQDEYGTFLTAKNNYLNGGLLSAFISSANQWIGTSFTISASYTPSSFSMNDGCSGTISLAPDTTYNLKVCLNDGSSDVDGSCKIYSTGEYSIGNILSTTSINVPKGNYRLAIKWNRVKDPQGRYDHGGDTDSGSIWSGCLGAGGASTCCPGGPSVGCSSFNFNEGIGCKVRGGSQNAGCYYSQSSCGGIQYVTSDLSVWRQHSCRTNEGYVRTGGSNAGGTCTIMNSFDNEGPGYGRACQDTQVGYVVGCTPGTNPSCPSNLCAYASSSTEYTSFFTIDSQSGSSLASLTQNLIISSGVLTWN